MDSMDNFRERFEALERRTQMVEQRLRWWRGIACSVIMLSLLSLALPAGKAADAPGRSMGHRMATMEKKLAAMDFDDAANEVVITGANLRIVNGLGATETTNGLGNLIVGYNELRPPVFPPFPPDDRMGSHNVVVGRGLNFSRFGGLVVGDINTISGDFASVSGGAQNTASGSPSSVSGGLQNTASGRWSSVSGGTANTASGSPSSVSGGGGNTASDGQASVSGGLRNVASFINASVSGGSDNVASGSASSVSGGSDNIASGTSSSVSGGIENTASGPSSVFPARGNSVSGGFRNTASGFRASVSGGENNTASGDFSSVSGGNTRSAPATDNWAAGALFSDQ